MYGSMSYMMITTGKGVAGFTLDDTLGERARRARWGGAGEGRGETRAHRR